MNFNTIKDRIVVRLNRFVKPRGINIKTSFILTSVFVLLAAGIVVSGNVYYRQYEKKYRLEVENQLQAIADMKTNEIMFWRARRLGDAETFYQNRAFSDLARRVKGSPGDRDSREKLRSWLQRVSDSHFYNNISLLDRYGYIIQTLRHEIITVDPVIASRCDEVLTSDKILFLDFFRDSRDNKIYLAILVPISDIYSKIGVVALIIDPARYLYPYIQNWPAQSRTAETLLVRRDGDNVLFLNNTRFAADSALNMRIPVSKKDILAVKAAFGEHGVVEGVDYRGERVIGYVGQIPGSPWSIVARIDSSEVYGPLRDRLRELLVMIAALLVSAGAGIGFVWRRETSRFYMERYSAAEALRASETRLRRAEKISHLGHISLECSTGYYIWSDEVYNIFGVEPGKFIISHKNILSCIHPDDRGKYDMIFSDSFSADNATVEFRVIRPDGVIRDVQLNSELITKARGNGKNIFGTLLDVTDLRQKERELQQKNEEVERFSYTVSHDLKSPLVTIKTFLGYIEKDMAGSDSERISRDLHYMNTAADRMSRLLDELLEMSRIGRVVNPPVRVSFSEITYDALNFVAGRIESRGVATRIDDKNIIMFGDRVRLVEIWQNLIENAVKFMGDSESPLIEIGAEGEGINTVFYVRDNGIGIDPKFHGKIFGLFERLNTAADGTGLGLTLVKRIVEIFAGHIWVESAGKGQGACFKFTLPGAFRNISDGEKL